MAQKRGKVTKERIIEIATELMDERGYHGMSLEDVAKRLKVTRPALYYYYSRKDQLLLDIHNRAQARLVESSEEIHERELVPLERLYLLLYNHASVTTKHARVVAVMFEEEHNLTPSERGKIRKVRIEYTQHFVDAYQQAVAEGHLLSDPDPRLTVFLMLGACNWITRWYKPGEWSPEVVAGTVARHLLRGVLTEAGYRVATKAGLLDT